MTLIPFAGHPPGLLAQLTSAERVSSEPADPAAAMANDQDVFKLMGLVALGAAVFPLLSPVLKGLMHLDNKLQERVPDGS
mgnify:CR=1 FL=1